MKSTTNISDLPMNPQTSVNNLPAISTQMPKNEVVYKMHT